MPHQTLLTLDIGCTAGHVHRLTPAIHRLPQDVRIHPEASEHPLVRLVEPTHPPQQPLFHIQGADQEAALRNAHEFFTRLVVVTSDPQTGVKRQRYTTEFIHWIEHYTQLAPPPSDVVDDIVTHRIWEGRRQADGREEFYQSISLNTTPFIVVMGQRWEVTNG